MIEGSLELKRFFLLLQILRTGNRFKIEVRLLVGNEIIGECTEPVIVSILPIKEAGNLNPETLKAHVEEEKKGSENKHGVINNNTGTFGNDKKKNVCDKSSVNFPNLQLKNIKRTGVNDCVAEDLFSFVFHTKITCMDMEIQLWTKSLPLAVVAHGIQTMQASTAVVWNNAGDNAFVMQEKQTWKKVN